MKTDQITINTQSSIRIEGSRIIYFDPFQIASEAHDADLILITHPHFDHLDAPSIEKVCKEDTIFIAPESILGELKSAAGSHRIISVKPGDHKEAVGLQIEAVPAYNQPLKPFHPRKNAWTGYIVTMDDIRYYAAGDTDAVKELNDITCDIAMVPIGGKYTMKADEAAALINRIRPATVIPIHYGTIVGKPEDAETFRKKVDTDIEVTIKL